MTNLNERAGDLLRLPKVYGDEEQFDPEHRIEHAWLLVEECREKEIPVVIETHKSSVTATARVFPQYRAYQHTKTTAPASITAACVEALESAK